MWDFPPFWIVFKYGLISLENPKNSKLDLQIQKKFVLSQKLYTNWLGLLDTKNAKKRFKSYSEVPYGNVYC